MMAATLPQTDTGPLESAIRTALSPVAPSSIRTEAEAFCAAFRASPDAWRICCEGLSNWSTDIEIRFFYAQTLALLLPGIQDRHLIRETLKVYARDLLSSAALRSPFSPDQGEAPVVLVRTAVVYAHCALADYPSSWPDAFTFLFDLLEEKRAGILLTHCCCASPDGTTPERAEQVHRQLIAGSQYILTARFVLAVFDCLYEDGIALSVKDQWRATTVKDALREGGILRLAQRLLDLLQDCSSTGPAVPSCWNKCATCCHCLTPAGGIGRARCELLTKSAQIAAQCVSWADVQIFVNSTFVNIAATALAQCPDALAGFIAAAFRKRMDPAQKIIMAHKLDLIQLLIRQVATATNGEAASSRCPSSAVLNVGFCLNLVGVELVDALVDLRRGYEHSVNVTQEEMRLLGGVAAVGPNPYFTNITSVEMWHKIQQVGQAHLFQALFPAALQVLRSSHSTELASTVLDFLHNSVKLVAQMLEAKPRSTSDEDFKISEATSLVVTVQEVAPFLSALLEVCLQRIESPADYNMNQLVYDKEDQEDEFVTFRGEVTHLFRRVFGVDKLGTSLQFLLNATREVTEVQVRSNGAGDRKIEAVLHVVCAAADSYKDLSKEVKVPEHAIAVIVRTILSSESILANPNVAVRKQICNLIIKFHKVIREPSLHPGIDLIRVTLGFLLGFSGLGSPRDNTREGKLEESRRITGAVISALLRFVRGDLNAVAGYAAAIIDAVRNAGILAIEPVPVEQWTTALDPSLDNDVVRLERVSTVNGAEFVTRNIKFQYPERLQGCAWTFDDQARCLEMVGLLINSQRKDPDSLNVLMQLLRPFCTQAVPCSADPSLLDCACRAIDAIAAITRGFSTDAVFASAWLECLGIVPNLLKYLRDVRVRNSVVHILRRLLAVLHRSCWPQVLLALQQILPVLFLHSAAAFAVCGGLRPLSPGANRHPSRIRMDLLSEKVMNQLGTTATTQVSSALWSYSGSVEFNQLLTFLSYCLITFKEAASEVISQPMVRTGTTPPFLLGFQDPSLEVLLTEDCSLFTQVFRIATDVWYCLPTSSPERLREKADLLRDLSAVIQSFITHVPDAFIKIVELEISEAGDQPTGSTVLVPWLCTAVSSDRLALPSPAESGTSSPLFAYELKVVQTAISRTANALINGLNGWSTLVLYLFKNSSGGSETVDAVGTVIFQKFKFSNVLRDSLQIVLCLDENDPQHLKIGHEFCILVRLFFGSLPNVPSSELPSRTSLPSPAGPLAALMREEFLRLCEACVVDRRSNTQSSDLSQQTIVAARESALKVLKLVESAATAREARGHLKEWIPTYREFLS